MLNFYSAPGSDASGEVDHVNPWVVRRVCQTLGP